MVILVCLNQIVGFNFFFLYAPVNMLTTVKIKSNLRHISKVNGVSLISILYIWKLKPFSFCLLLFFSPLFSPIFHFHHGNFMQQNMKFHLGWSNLRASSKHAGESVLCHLWEYNLFWIFVLPASGSWILICQLADLL